MLGDTIKGNLICQPLFCQLIIFTIFHSGDPAKGDGFKGAEIEMISALQTASQSASPSAINGETTNGVVVEKDRVRSLSVIVQPSPAVRQFDLQAASDLTIAQCSDETALVTMSSEESPLSLKMVLFLASQICHNSHGARQLFDTPDGGKLTLLHSQISLSGAPVRLGLMARTAVYIEILIHFLAKPS
ncbi:hypothetical protein F2Q70_00022503 [Brassica cretica]|uniref:Uncharacterized protein n=1 Tax=Brassica cretica TaxID=69181 RepID=A0A8S9HGF4_BRACR|nr:hypothetical protein F2Q70_00022503 [Brassica cretica]KAF2556214.1 hypothetical protein F2Q68_00016670 [Brassica cretica]